MPLTRLRGLRHNLSSFDIVASYIHKNAIDPIEGIETLIGFPMNFLHHCYYKNAIDPIEGIETILLPLGGDSPKLIRMPLTRLRGLRLSTHSQIHMCQMY